VETVLAVDVSAWTGPISGAQWYGLGAKGIELLVVGLWHGASANPYAQQQLAGAELSRMMRAGYVALAGRFNGADDVVNGVKPLDYPPLAFVAVDVELPDVTAEDVRAAVDCARAGGYRAIIYTGAWFWNWWLLREHDWFYAHPDGFSDCPAWLADYDYVPELDTALLGMLGPVVGKQFQGTTEFVPGCIVDLNVFDAAWLKGGEMDEAQVKAIVDPVSQRLSRALALERERREIQVGLDRWMLAYGTGDEDEFFQECCRL